MVACPAADTPHPIKTFFLWHLSASLTRLGEAECDCLFPAFNFFAGAAAFEGAGLAFHYRALNLPGSAF
jgi:hypothetical protein